jgi:predicted transcriptional regulator
LAKKRTPEERNSELEIERQRVRRKYRKNTDKGRKVRLGENKHVENQVVIFTIAGYTKKQISQIIGISKGKVASYLDKPETQELMDKTLQGLTEAALDLLHSYSIEAVQAIADVMRSSDDDAVILKAAAEILDRSGVPKASRSEQKIHKTEEELTTIQDDGIVDKLRTLPPETQEEAAQIVERLEEMLAQVAEGEAVNDEADEEN